MSEKLKPQPGVVRDSADFPVDSNVISQKVTTRIEPVHRDECLDAVSGMMILFMVIFHIAGQYERTDIFTTPSFRPLMFFMFWFFYKGGIVDKDREFREVISTGFSRLVVPAFVWLILGAAVHESVNLLLSRSLGLTWALALEFLHDGSVVYHLPVWFLFSLFFVRVLYSSIRSVSGVMKLLICGLCLVAASLLNNADAGLPLYISNILLGLAFYLLGKVMKTIDDGWSIIISALVVYLLILTLYPSSIDFRTNLMIEGEYPIALLFSFSGCVLLRGIFRIFGLRFFQNIGRHSMVWLLIHWPVKYVGGIIVGQLPEMGFVAITIFLLLLTAISVEGGQWITTKFNLSFIFGGSPSPIKGRSAGSGRSIGLGSVVSRTS